MSYTTISNRTEFTAALDKTEESSSPLMVVSCHTNWCPQCKAVAPKIDELTEEFGEGKGVAWYKLNIENAEDVAHEYGVNAVPTFMVFKDGGMLPEEKITGPYDRQVKEAIEKCLKQ